MGGLLQIVEDLVWCHRCNLRVRMKGRKPWYCWGVFGMAKYLLSSVHVFAQPHILPVHYQNHHSPLISSTSHQLMSNSNCMATRSKNATQHPGHVVKPPRIPANADGKTTKDKKADGAKAKAAKAVTKSWVLHNVPSSSRRLLKERICLMVLPAQTSPLQPIRLWHLPPNPMLPSLFWKVRWIPMKAILTS